MSGERKPVDVAHHLGKVRACLRDFRQMPRHRRLSLEAALADVEPVIVELVEASKQVRTGKIRPGARARMVDIRDIRRLEAALDAVCGGIPDQQVPA